MTIHDATLLDNVSDLSKLSKRQLLERLVRTSERIELIMTAEGDALAAALGSLDTQLSDLGSRVDAQAQALAQYAQDATDLEQLKAQVASATDGISSDAQKVASMAPSQVVSSGGSSDSGSAGTPVVDPAAGGAGDAGSSSADAGSGSAPVDGGANGPLPPVADPSGTDASGAPAGDSGAVGASGDVIPTE